MTHRRLLIVFIFLSGVPGFASNDAAQTATEKSVARRQAAQRTAADQYVGTYSGTWDGSGTGNFELTLAKGNDGGPTGKVAVTTDGGNYDAELKAVAFDGNKMTAKYDFPLDPSAEVALAATFDAGTARGTWSLRAKGQNDEIAGGTWTVSKK
jgi:hypothetical protein